MSYTYRSGAHQGKSADTLLSTYRAASFQGGDIRKLFAEFQLSEDIKAVEKKKEERAKKNHITPENHPLRKLRTVNTIEPGRNRRPKYRERG